ncbi:hypothetical protein A2U01_0084983, partial [Trifolium medium]|nr:hypothetical protein [Trifolium medium]
KKEKADRSLHRYFRRIRPPPHCYRVTTADTETTPPPRILPEPPPSPLFFSLSLSPEHLAAGQPLSLSLG